MECIKCNDGIEQAQTREYHYVELEFPRFDGQTPRQNTAREPVDYGGQINQSTRHYRDRIWFKRSKEYSRVTHGWIDSTARTANTTSKPMLTANMTEIRQVKFDGLMAREPVIIRSLDRLIAAVANSILFYTESKAYAEPKFADFTRYAVLTETKIH